MSNGVALVTFLVVGGMYALAVWAWAQSDDPIITRTKTTTYRKAPSVGTKHE